MINSEYKKNCLDPYPFPHLKSEELAIIKTYTMAERIICAKKIIVKFLVYSRNIRTRLDFQDQNVLLPCCVMNMGFLCLSGCHFPIFLIIPFDFTCFTPRKSFCFSNSPPPQSKSLVWHFYPSTQKTLYQLQRTLKSFLPSLFFLN
jgi:hypothetical protein